MLAFGLIRMGPAMLREAIEARSRESDPQADASYLALSGGSDNGAFGAGVLVGGQNLVLARH